GYRVLRTGRDRRYRERKRPGAVGSSLSAAGANVGQLLRLPARRAGGATVARAAYGAQRPNPRGARVGALGSPRLRRRPPRGSASGFARARKRESRRAYGRDRARARRLRRRGAALLVASLRRRSIHRGCARRAVARIDRTRRRRSALTPRGYLASESSRRSAQGAGRVVSLPAR